MKIKHINAGFPFLDPNSRDALLDLCKKVNTIRSELDVIQDMFSIGGFYKTTRTLYGQLIRLGGENETSLEIKDELKDNIFIIHASKDVVKKLSNKLYDNIAIQVELERDMMTGQYKNKGEFIKEEYYPKRLYTLPPANENYFPNIKDALEYVEDMRNTEK